MIYSNILETIGNTPSIKVKNISINNTNIYVKAEFFNPASSVKDRLAISIIENAEKNGSIEKGQTVVEATSGNTGIGLAMVCAAKNYPLVVTMPDSASIERRKLMRFLGARVILTPASEGGTGAYDIAKRLVHKNNWFFARQFENEDNANIHEETTGIEIYNDFKDIGLDYWVSGYGTGGTFTGVSRTLREKLPKIGVLHVDVDLYSSSCQVLKFIKPLLCKGSVILFDDWYCFPVGMYEGEAKAFNEFLEENRNIKVEEWKNYSTFGKSFFVTGVD